MADAQTSRIRELNDAFRKAMARDVYLTAGVVALPAEIQTEAIWRVKTFDAFNEETTPEANMISERSISRGRNSFGSLMPTTST